jgi:hypothetical protein
MDQRTDTPSPGSDTTIVKSKNEARQGVTGHNVRYVLWISVAAVIILFAIVWFVYFGHGSQ